jgi:phosphoserine phosphatase
MGTLTTGAPVLGMLDWVRSNQSKFQANVFMARMLPGYLVAKARLIDWQRWGQNLMVDSLSLVKDATPEKLGEAAEWVVEKNLWAKRRSDVIARLMLYAENNADVYIASSVYQPAVESFARRVGAKAIGTPVEIVNGRVQLASELVASEKKIEQVLSRIGVERVDFAYGDTMMDVPLLEHAEHPVAVYPEDNLRALAKKRGWEIIGETASYP